ncbi:hypothetical protein LZL87_010551 [Fusarium oxysporum]|uniref:Mid2 domain-containing protein n=1 Tax=Fusarium oxysporum f. sp. rapae TaxID=485398 RepID=A0A8J5NL09_FUSOX|nr:hypothetical protein Forpe1208_v013697 [Fusarium oxysporum f. sp. rapae]KAI7763486.1 hypothetical protein LZL87_010551 [Fusarium oxysporum]
MSLLTIISLVLTLLATLGSCYSKFTRPPEWDSEQDADRDMILNQHYDTGDKIPILYETNLKNTELWVWQVLDDFDAGAQLKDIETSWQAQYDIADALRNDEDSVYYFELYQPDDKAQLAKSQYVNVSAPRRDKTETVTVSVSLSRILTFSTQASTLQTSTTSASDTDTGPTDSSSSDEPDSTSEAKSGSGLSSSATGGVAAGATIGGLLIFGGIGWLAWRRLARKKQDRPISELPADLPQQHQPDPSQTKAELTGDPGTYPPGYARSPSGIHEAP